MTMNQLPKHNNLIFDLGMHRGEDTEYYFKKGFRVVAFEANPDLVAENRLKFPNELDDGRLIIVSGAIVPEENLGKPVRFYRNPSMTVWGTVDQEFADRNARVGAGFEEIEVQAVDFKSELHRYGVPYYMKVDLEGVDQLCLFALKDVDPRPDFISLESEKTSMEGLLEEIQILDSLGYQRFQAVQQFGMSWQKEQKDAREGCYTGHSFSEGSSGVFGRDLNGERLNMDEVIEKYKAIFQRYRRWGDESVLNRVGIMRHLLYAFSRLIRRPLPGWYDTHACLHENPQELRDN